VTDIDELHHDADEWWGYSTTHGWVVLDRKDERNSNGAVLTFVRCSDWTEFECPSSRWPSNALVFFKAHLRSLEGSDQGEAIKELLALREEYARRQPVFRETGHLVAENKREAGAREELDAEEARRRAITEKHDAFLITKGLPASGVRASSGKKANPEYACERHGNSGEGVAYECLQCGKVICGVCGACYCGYAPQSRPSFLTRGKGRS